ncbi:MAG: hypothetical protein NTY38_32575, partial [Acidobacteria bacterium]|nr:hypothetical protein [Acidobacteriota bacterium]
MRKLMLCLCLALPCTAAYQYYHTDQFFSFSSWWQNGTVTLLGPGFWSGNANGGSLISAVNVPDGTARYEVRTMLTLGASGGTYIQYLRASQDALSGPAPSGTYYAIELQNPTFAPDGHCTATLAAYKRVGGMITALGSNQTACSNG